MTAPYLNTRVQNQEIELSNDAYLFKKPFKCLISGSSGIGKTSLICDMFKHQESVFGSAFKSVIYCTQPGALSLVTSDIQKLRDCCPEIIVHEGLYNPEDIQDPENCLIICDDLINAIGNFYQFQSMNLKQLFKCF